MTDDAIEVAHTEARNFPPDRGDPCDVLKAMFARNEGDDAIIEEACAVLRASDAIEVAHKAQETFDALYAEIDRLRAALDAADGHIRGFHALDGCNCLNEIAHALTDRAAEEGR